MGFNSKYFACFLMISALLFCVSGVCAQDIDTLNTSNNESDLNNDVEQFVIFDNENFTADNADNSVEQISKSDGDSGNYTADNADNSVEQISKSDGDSGNYTIGENNTTIKIDNISVYSLSDLARNPPKDGYIETLKKVSDNVIFDLLPLARKILKLIS
ncbi:hypothetical protein [uncultured Methanobrevibacter sp.]|uniref:hypothetical protein n=1 Tax=uncultured Methanobrevibacter sp. TaxID=253161 RepID=UPI0025E0EBBE|nr:hypothetical protein [uncultured Methanobrevibacter sp.]